MPVTTYRNFDWSAVCTEVKAPNRAAEADTISIDNPSTNSQLEITGFVTPEISRNPIGEELGRYTPEVLFGRLGMLDVTLRFGEYYPDLLRFMHEYKYEITEPLVANGFTASTMNEYIFTGKLYMRPSEDWDRSDSLRQTEVTLRCIRYLEENNDGDKVIDIDIPARRFQSFGVDFMSRN